MQELDRLKFASKITPGTSHARDMQTDSRDLAARVCTTRVMETRPLSMWRR